MTYKTDEELKAIGLESADIRVIYRIQQDQLERCIAAERQCEEMKRNQEKIIEQLYSLRDSSDKRFNSLIESYRKLSEQYAIIYAFLVSQMNQGNLPKELKEILKKTMSINANIVSISEGNIKNEHN